MILKYNAEKQKKKYYKEDSNGRNKRGYATDVDLGSPAY